MSLIQRLAFGTARLAGGAYAAQSRALLETCLAAGVRTIDTAPAYGMGAAEALIGDVTAGDPRIAIHTKAGLPRPTAPALKGWGKRIKALRPSGSSVAWNPRLVDYAGPSPEGDYSPAALARSIERSQRLLRTDRFAMLLLHAAEPRDIDGAAWQVFEQARDSGIAADIGFAHPGPAKSRPAGVIRQLAPRPGDFRAAGEAPAEVWHSIRTATELAAQEADIAAELERIAAALSGGDMATRRFVAGLVLLARVAPSARLVFATTSPDRLKLMLEMVADVPSAEIVA